MHFKKDRLPLKKKKKNNLKITIHHFSCRLENPIATKNVESKQTKETQHNLKKKIQKKTLKTNKTKSQPQITNLVYYFQTLMYVYLSLLLT